MNVRERVDETATAAAFNAADKARMDHLRSICDGIGSAVKMLTDDISAHTKRSPSEPNENEIKLDNKARFLRKAQELSDMLKTELPQIIEILQEERRL